MKSTRTEFSRITTPIKYFSKGVPYESAVRLNSFLDKVTDKVGQNSRKAQNDKIAK